MKKILLFLITFCYQSFYSQTPKLAIVAQQCGVNTFGGIVTVDGSGLNDSLRFSFNSINGTGALSSLLQATNGKFYGTTYSGGSNSMGVLYNFDMSTNTYTKLLDFNGANGISPNGDLIEPSSGKIYGVTQTGGKNNKGVIFSYDINNNIYTKLANFDTIGANTAYDGLCKASNGKLYGLTANGGTYNVGVLYSFDMTNNTLTKLFDFGLPGSGIRPYGKLMQSSNGKLYGLTQDGGTNTNGTLFSFNISSNTHTKESDLYLNTGGTSQNSILEAPNGKFYSNLQGGSTPDGTLIEYDTIFGFMTAVVNFSLTDGSYPGNMILGSDGMIYGTTREGGTSSGCTFGCGTVFKYNYNTGNLTSLYSLNPTVGCFPVRSITEFTLNSIGIEELGGNKKIISIHPNPTSNILTIKTNSKINSPIEIINCLGEIVLKQSFSETIDVSKLNPGVYFIKVDNSYSKFIKE